MLLVVHFYKCAVEVVGCAACGITFINVLWWWLCCLWFNFCPYCFDGVGCAPGSTLNTDPTVKRFGSTLGPVLI